MPNKLPSTLSQSRVFSWNRCFLKQDPSLFIDRQDSPYRRLSITILIASNKPFTYNSKDSSVESYQGVILGSNFERHNLQALDADITVFDAFITTQVYKDLERCIKPNESRSLTQEELDKVLPMCRASCPQEMALEDATALFDSVVYAICERNIQCDIDTRVQRVIDLVEQRPADELSVSLLAKEVNVSESRLRALFKQEMHCTLSQYIRSVSVWKTIPLLAQGMSFTDVAHEAGFHDLAHFSRAVSEVIGFPPSSILKEKELAVSLDTTPNSSPDRS